VPLKGADECMRTISGKVFKDISNRSRHKLKMNFYGECRGRAQPCQDWPKFALDSMS
jgi:hypothetical protein